ncbi:uncharacterized protein LOC111621676 [Centruroides sculpturatus]|uniref:uncharacterized protein LOC111621676 n=1 Tax=Centruroides sculpturatus TaxID=218467 RepID=UPI000C6E82A5|nr:uncharacterized protein LOC111621676 [Centruroides sculpturatus]
MNCFGLLGILLVLECRFLKAQSDDWKIEIRQINSKLADISNKITSIDRLTSKIDFIRLSLDLVNSKLDNSKRRIEETENNVKRISEICFGNEKEIQNERSSSQKLIESNLSNKIDHYGNKMLKEQQNMKNSSGHQTLLLYEIQNITVSGLNKMLTKLETLLVSFNQQIHLFTGISSKAKDLLTRSIEHESQLIDLEEKLTENENWFKKSDENLKTRFLQLWSNISLVLNEKKGDLSQRALFRLTRTINQTEEIINLITEMGGLLEPKVIHVTRLSEMISKNLKDKTSEDISSIANNLTTSLQALRDTAPSMMLALSVNANSLLKNLINLKNLDGNKSRCETDAIEEIRKHHAEMSKFISDTKENIETRDENAEKIWDEVMKKLQNIPQKISEVDDGNALQKLQEISREIKECRAILNKFSFDTTFG